MSEVLKSNDSEDKDCEQLHALLPDYVIGASDPDEVRLVEELLQRCPDGAANLADYEAMTEALLHSAPPVQPPASLRASLLAALDDVPQSSPARVIPPVMPAPETHLRPTPAIHPMPVTAAPTAPTSKISTFPAARWLAAVAAIAVVMLVASNMFWLNRDAEARARVADLMAREQAVLAMLEQQQAVLASLGDVTTQRYTLASTDAGPATAQAVAFWRPGNAYGLLSVAGLPEPEAGRTYQFWLIRGEQAIPAGLLDVGADGRGTLIFDASEPVDSFDAIGVSEEPAGGSEAPTTTPVLVGSISA
jgi:anti-sigma-K factor RskA